MSVLYYLSIGVLFGLTAGFSPGPLLTLVVAETLEHGVPSGIKVALAPIVTDAPIITVALLVSVQLASADKILGIISLIGGCYVFYMGYESIRQEQRANDQGESKPKPLIKGVLTNALSPHPYLFWLSVGAPTVAKSLKIGIIAPLLFIGGFYSFLLGAKILLAVVVGKSRSFLSNKAYIYTMKLLGMALCVFAIMLFADGLELLRISKTLH